METDNPILDFKLVLVTSVGLINIIMGMPMESYKKFGVNDLFSITIVHIAKRGILTIYCPKRNHDFELVLTVQSLTYLRIKP